MLKNQENSGIIDINIDKFAPCLEDAKTGEILDTQVYKIINKNELKGLTQNTGWYINWSKEIDLGHEVYALKIKNNDDIQ